MAPRDFDVLYSDDVRYEVGGKVSYIGCYNGELWVKDFPLTLPKLCVTLWARIPHSNPVESLIFRVFKNDELLHEQNANIADVPQAHSADFWEQQRPSDMETFTMLMTTVIFSPMLLEDACYIRVRAFTSDGDELKAPALHIRIAPPEFKEFL